MPKTTSQPQVKIVPLGGASMVNKNMFVYEYQNNIVIVDCGIGFPELEQLGVDMIIPDVSYLKDKLSQIRAIVITHGHEDHFGALPYLIEDLGNPPVYASKLVYGFIQAKLEEFGLLRKVNLKCFKSEDVLAFGSLTFIPFRVNHSIPDAFGFFIRTPIGNIIHVADFKFDWTPVDGKLIEIAKIADLSSQGVHCLLSDCLGSTSSGYTRSERVIQTTFEREIEHAPGQFFITTVSSNISRIQQAVNTAVKFGRKVCFVGMSISRNVEVAQNLGYLEIPPNTVVNSDLIHRYPDHKLLIVIAGSYGQPGSSLVRLANDQHRLVRLKENAVVVFSADPIPGVIDQVGVVIDKMVEKGARVVYSEIQENLHVSGHGSQGDLSMMAGLIQPNYFVPIGGGPRHMRAYADLMEQMGFARQKVLELREGEGIELTADTARKKKMVSLTNIFVDGSTVGDVGEVVLRDRQVLSEEGIFIVIIKKGKKGKFSENIYVVSRGFVYMAISDDLVKRAKELVKREIKDKRLSEWSKIKNRIEKNLADFLYRKTERNPMILVVLVD